MLKRCLFACVLAGCLSPAIALAYGEPRIVPDYDFFFENDLMTLYPEATVVRVLSGNQVLVQIEDDKELRTIELAGIENVAELEPGLEDEAIAFLESALLHQSIRLEGDDYMRSPAGEGIIEAYLWLNGEQLNDAMVSEGLAIVRNSNYNIRYRPSLRESQAEAINNRLGVWESGAAEPSTDVQILELLFN